MNNEANPQPVAAQRKSSQVNVFEYSEHVDLTGRNSTRKSK
jgi:hypothetical protein